MSFIGFMKALIRSIAFFLGSSAIAPAALIEDPLVDFLSLPIDDRCTDVSSVVRVERIWMDLDSDGKPELLLGHPKLWQGDNNGVYFAIYKKLGERDYARLTQPSEDIRMVLGDGLPEFVFVGQVDEAGKYGLLIANSPLGDSELNGRRVESLLFVSIYSGAVEVTELPGLDLRKFEDKETYDKYFGHAGHQGGYLSESLTSDQLKASGMVLPDWTKRPVVSKSEVNSAAKTPSGVESAIVRKEGPEAGPEQRQASRWSQSLLWCAVILGVFVVVWLARKKRDEA